MILSTHAVVGAALASLMPSHPAEALAVGFASHFLVDAIPHWDYPLRSISLGPSARNDVRVTAARLRDLVVVGIDAFAGLAVAIGVFGTKANLAAVMAGAVGGIIPDALQFVYTLYPRQPLTTLQRFHTWIHSNRKLGWRLGVGSQVAFVSAVVGATFAVQLLN